MRRPSARSFIIGMLAFAAGLVGTQLFFRGPMEQVTEESLERARQTWNAAQIRSYDVKYELNSDNYEVQVRDGIVIEVLANGTRPVSTNWSNYSIDGLFELLALELENLTNPHGPFGSQVNAVLAKVRFDDAFGYPAYYLRSGGGARQATVRVREFVKMRP